MTLEKALIIFGLDKNYTKEKLKKRYYELMRKNHPDYHMNADEKEWDKYNKKTQEINEAHEILKRNIDNKKSYYQNSKNNSPNNTYTITREIINSYYTICNDITLTQKVQKLILNYLVKLEGKSNYQEVIYEFKKKLQELYQEHILIYSKINKIPSFIIEEYQFNYDCNCRQFYSQLQSCKNKIENDINNIIKELKNYKHYSILKEDIDKEIYNLKQEIYNCNITKEIYLETLSTYSEKIKNIFNNYNQKYHRLILLFKIILPQLDNNISEKLREKAEMIALKTNDIELSKIYNDLLEELNYNSKSKEEIYHELRNLYIKSNPEFQEINDKLFSKATALLFNKNCPTEILLTICMITFINPKKELSKLEQLEKIFNISFLDNEEFFCIRKSKSPLVYKAKRISSENNRKTYYEIKYPGHQEIICDKKTFQNEYIPLKYFLDNSAYLGYESQGAPIIQLLYYNINTGKILGRRKNGPFQMFNESILKKRYFSQNKNLHHYSNEKYLEQELLKTYDEEYVLINKNKHRK